MVTEVLALIPAAASDARFREVCTVLERLTVGSGLDYRVCKASIDFAETAIVFSVIGDPSAEADRIVLEARVALGADA